MPIIYKCDLCGCFKEYNREIDISEIGQEFIQSNFISSGNKIILCTKHYSKISKALEDPYEILELIADYCDIEYK